MADTASPAIPDEELDDNPDSLFQSDAASSTQSITTSILDFCRENGRTYHRYKAGKYVMPNDNTENERLDLQNYIFLVTFENKLGLAPSNDADSKVKRVLDLGTGTGIWALDYADEHPEAEVTGIDLSPVQPGFVPPNVQFIVDDIDEEWNYTRPFDYIHSRMMTMSVKDWKDYLKKIFDNLEPGGYVELQEVDSSLTSDDGTLTTRHRLHKWCKLLNEACIQLGRPMVPLAQIKEYMAEAGFVDIVDTHFKWPTNQWPEDKKLKTIGQWNNINTGYALEGAALAPFSRVHGWSREDIAAFVAGARMELNDPAIHAYWPIVSMYGRKPAP
ncbi:S-adenosyl-L-methionine-dependent methyltransferase [Thelonectria olida]|uniref:S-adenosyl-L-methionine-dependent methyltransferase n=1 Tax=Thelonectria olida TaxID=1576542 RepID=A0A9P8VSJ6_9HYPO|nr:S-adenosyl-L-methionine-dependent methyltransferase [Thelonectria olida]